MKTSFVGIFTMFPVRGKYPVTRRALGECQIARIGDLMPQLSIETAYMPPVPCGKRHAPSRDQSDFQSVFSENAGETPDAGRNARRAADDGKTPADAIGDSGGEIAAEDTPDSDSQELGSNEETLAGAGVAGLDADFPAPRASGESMRIGQARGDGAMAKRAKAEWFAQAALVGAPEGDAPSQSGDLHGRGEVPARFQKASADTLSGDTSKSLGEHAVKHRLSPQEIVPRQSGPDQVSQVGAPRSADIALSETAAEMLNIGSRKAPGGENPAGVTVEAGMIVPDENTQSVELDMIPKRASNVKGNRDLAAHAVNLPADGPAQARQHKPFFEGEALARVAPGPSDDQLHPELATATEPRLGPGMTAGHHSPESVSGLFGAGVPPIQTRTDMSPKAGKEEVEAPDAAIEGVSGGLKLGDSARPAQAATLHPASAPLSRQLVEVAGHLKQGAVEVQLAPEELGRVRMKLIAGDGGHVLHITADRTETLDLLRRNADMLSREFRDAGFGGLDLAFGSSDRGRQERSPSGEPGQQTAPQTQEPAPLRNGTRDAAITATSSLDMRL